MLFRYLSLRSLTRAFGARRAVDGVTLDIREGEFFTIVGPSGSGKSTLVRMLAGLEVPTSGDILLRGSASTTCRPTAGRPPWCSSRWRCSIT